MSFNPGLIPGRTIVNSQLTDIFKCAPQGGMRRSHRTNTLVIISDHTKSIYEDHWDNDVLYYTGMGINGHQDLNFAQNKTLNESNTNGVELHLFEVYEPTKYIYRGKVRLEHSPYQQNQLDPTGQIRKVWIFPLKTTDHNAKIGIPQTLLIKKQEMRERLARKLSDSELLKRAKNAKKIGSRQTITITHERDPYVTEFAKRRAQGICQLCNKSAPFINNKGEPYLETHHIEWLSNGGEDTIENTVALCPNCHRKMHALNLKNDVKLLKDIAGNY
jgi:5-methylcytosine-specific restriction protein A